MLLVWRCCWQDCLSPFPEKQSIDYAAADLSAIIHANRAIKAGDGDLFIAGGVENMTRGPYVIAKPSSAFGNDSKMYDSSFGWRFINPKMQELYGTDGMGNTAENLVEKYNISQEKIRMRLRIGAR